VSLEPGGSIPCRPDSVATLRVIITVINLLIKVTLNVTRCRGTLQSTVVLRQQNEAYFYDSASFDWQDISIIINTSISIAHPYSQTLSSYYSTHYSRLKRKVFSLRRNADVSCVILR